MTVVTTVLVGSWPRSRASRAAMARIDVAVDQGAVLVDGQQPVGVAVVGQADLGAAAGQGGLDVLGVGGADAGVDVVAVGVGGDGGDLGPGAPVGLGGDLGGGAVGAVDHHLQAVQVGDALQQVGQVGLDRVVGRGPQARRRRGRRDGGRRGRRWPRRPRYAPRPRRGA
jgi:hypothetical protein